MHLPFLGLLALLGRILGLGFERPVFKALSREQDSLVATTLAYTIALLLLLPVVVLGLLGADPFSNLRHWLHLALISGIIAALAYNLYVYAFSKGDVSVLAPLYSTGLLFLYVLELIFGSAVFSWLALGGILLVGAGLSLLSADGPGGWRSLLQPGRVLREPGALAMVLAALLLAVVRIVDKGASSIAPEGGYALLATVPTVAIGLLILGIRGRLMQMSTLARLRPWPALGSGAAHIGGYLILLAAYRFFNASVIEPVGQLALFVNIALGWLWFKEPVKHRWLPAGMVATGAVLVLLSR